MMIIIGSGIFVAAIGIGAIGYKKHLDNKDDNFILKKDKKHEDKVEVLYRKIKEMNPYQKDGADIFKVGQEIINAALYIRDSKNKSAWYLDSQFLLNLIEYNNLYKDLLNKYSDDAHIEQFLFEGLVRPYQSFWINLEKQTPENRLSFVKDMIDIFVEYREKYEEEAKLLVNDNELKENVILYNQRIESKEVVSQIFEDSISHLKDKKKYSIAKTINDTQNYLNEQAVIEQPTEEQSQEQVAEKTKKVDSFNIDSIESKLK